MGMKWNIWGKKLAKHVVVILVAGLAATYGNNQLFLALAPLFYAIENAVKHFN